MPETWDQAEERIRRNRELDALYRTSSNSRDHGGGGGMGRNSGQGCVLLAAALVLVALASAGLLCAAVAQVA